MTSVDKDKIELRGIIFKYLNSWYLFAILLAVAILGASFYIRRSDRIYEAQARFLIRSGTVDNNMAGTQDAFAGLSSGVGTNFVVSNELEVINSRLIFNDVVRRLNLNITYSYQGRYKREELYKNAPFSLEIVSQKDSLPWKHFQLLPNLPKTGDVTIVDDQGKKAVHVGGDTVRMPDMSFVVLANPNGEYHSEIDVNIAPIDKTSDSYLGQVKITNASEGSSVLLMKLQGTVPQKIEDILNVLYDVYSNISIEDKTRVVDSTIRFIDERMSVLGAEISNSQDSINQFLIANKLVNVDASALTGSIAKVVDNNENLKDLYYQNNLLKAFVKKLQSESFPLVPSDLTISNADFNKFAMEYNKLIASRIHHLQQGYEANPLIQGLNKQIAETKANLLTAANFEIIQQNTVLSRTEYKSAEADQKLNQTPAYQKVYQSLSRGLDIKQGLYEMLLNKKESLEIFRAGSSTNSKLIDPAKCNGAAIKPQIKLIYLLFVLVAIIAGILMIAIKDLFDNKVKSKEEIMDATQLPVLGELYKTTHSSARVILEKPRSVLAEQIRSLRTNTEFLLGGKIPASLLITSSMSGEGKSFVAVNLAISLAMSGNKTILLEFDLRKPRISSYLDISVAKGFSQYALGRATLTDIVVTNTGIENLSLIGAGPIPPNPSELLAQASTADLIEKLKAEYDYVIIDTAPIGLVTDAAMLGKQVDACLFVVRHNYTFKEQLPAIRNLKEQNRLPNVGIVMNAITKKSGGYGYGYGYGYGAYGKYSDGYYADEEKLSLWDRLKKRKKE